MRLYSKDELEQLPEPELYAYAYILCNLHNDKGGVYTDRIYSYNSNEINSLVDLAKIAILIEKKDKHKPGEIDKWIRSQMEGLDNEN